MSRIRLTDAQVSAIECRPVEEMPGVLAGNWLEFSDAERMAKWLNEASNAEDAQAELFGCKYARRAAASLSCLFGKTLRLAA